MGNRAGSTPVTRTRRKIREAPTIVQTRAVVGFSRFLPVLENLKNYSKYIKNTLIIKKLATLSGVQLTRLRSLRKENEIKKPLCTYAKRLNIISLSGDAGDLLRTQAH